MAYQLNIREKQLRINCVRTTCGYPQDRLKKFAILQEVANKYRRKNQIYDALNY